MKMLLHKTNYGVTRDSMPLVRIQPISANPSPGGLSSQELEVVASPSSNGYGIPARDRRVQLVRMLLEESPERQWELTDMAKTVNLSSGRMAHLFKSEIGVSIQQYLTQIRLAKAMQQLESSFLSIKEIAASVGFRNVNRFTTSFKTAVGATPAEYRRRPALAQGSRKDLVIARSANR